MCGALFVGNCFAQAASVSDYAVRVSATVHTNPPRITLSWPGDPNATGYTLYRKLRDARKWVAVASLGASATSWIDSNVTVGGSYEYWVAKSAGAYLGDGYIYAGIEAPLVEFRGKLVLLVDSTCAAGLSLELARLEQDLAGDGWTVLRHDVARMSVAPANVSSNVWVARSNELARVKGIIQTDYYADPANVKAVFLFGHVPVPYSGNMAPDDHYNHVGAWPADAFYGDLDGTWTDSSVVSTDVGDQRTRNVPGDGKFDQTELPSELELQVGRVDFANLPAFAVSEGELLGRYLNKDHYFRRGLITAERRGLIDDQLGVQSGWEAPAANGWRVLAPLFGAANTLAGDWLTTLSAQSYLWGYGCGGGTYTSASGVATTAQLAVSDPQVVFTMLFGSYFGDWDSQDNLLRAELGTPTYTLASVWAGRPFWLFHHMALGETLGFSARVTQNNSSLYSAGLFSYYAHVALLGDPTLWMHPVAPPAALTVVTNGSGGANLTWTASPDTVVGYHVYSAPPLAGPFRRLTANLLSGTSYTDAVASANVYMVRAVKLEKTPSGSYYNPSQGIFQSLDGSAGAPRVELFEPTNNASFGSLPSVKLSASLLDPANAVTNVAFFANGNLIGSSAGPIYTTTWASVPGGVYSITARAQTSAGLQTNSSPVTIQVATGTPVRLTITPAGTSSNRIAGNGEVGRVYRVLFVDDLSRTNWQTLGTATGSLSGVFQLLDSSTSTQRFYRTAYP